MSRSEIEVRPREQDAHGFPADSRRRNLMTDAAGARPAEHWQRTRSECVDRHVRDQCDVQAVLCAGTYLRVFVRTYPVAVRFTAQVGTKHKSAPNVKVRRLKPIGFN
jgi:hypothetical protein